MIRQHIVTAGVLLVGAAVAFGQQPTPACPTTPGEEGNAQRKGMGMMQGEKHGMMRGGEERGEMREAMVERIINNPKMIEKLALTEDQVKTLRDGVMAQKEQEIDLRANMERASLEQAKLLTETKPDRKALISAVKKAGDIRTQMACLRMEGILLLKETLTTEQLQKLEEMKQSRQERGDKQGQERKHRKQKTEGSEDQGSKEEKAPVAPPAE